MQIHELIDTLKHMPQGATVVIETSGEFYSTVYGETDRVEVVEKATFIGDLTDILFESGPKVVLSTHNAYMS